MKITAKAATHPRFGYPEIRMAPGDPEAEAKLSWKGQVLNWSDAWEEIRLLLTQGYTVEFAPFDRRET